MKLKKEYYLGILPIILLLIPDIIVRTGHPFEFFNYSVHNTFCEIKSNGIFIQPIAAWTSLSFWWVSLWMSSRKKLLSPACAFLAMGSLLNHGCVCVLGNVLDWVGMWLVVSTLAISSITNTTNNNWLVPLAYGLSGLPAVLRFGTQTAQNGSYILLLIMGSITLILHLFKIKTVKTVKCGYLLKSLALLILSFICWFLDQTTWACKWSYGILHGLWHIGISLVLILLNTHTPIPITNIGLPTYHRRAYSESGLLLSHEL